MSELNKGIRESGNQAMLRFDRVAVMFSLVSITALAWLYLFNTPLGMESIEGLDVAIAQANGTSWTVQDAIMMFLMWAVMMVGMMVPAAFPMILMYSSLTRNQPNKAGIFAPTTLFVIGYMFIWTAFSLAATALQWGLQGIGILSSMMMSSSSVFNGLILIAAGIYQWTPIKNMCLRNCQTPLGFLMNNWRDGRDGAFRMGLAHGVYCIGCCWVLMGLLFVGGVMNLLWIAAIATFVLLEKVIPSSLLLPRLAGSALIVWGSLLLLQN